MKYYSYDYVILHDTVKLLKYITLDELVGPKISSAQSRRVRQVGYIERASRSLLVQS